MRRGSAARCCATARARGGAGGGGGRAFVLFDLRVEDVGSGRTWDVARRYSSFFAVRERLCRLVPGLSALPFPGKQLPDSFGGGGDAARLEPRAAGLEAFVREAAAFLTARVLRSAAEPEALRLLQAFLGVRGEEGVGWGEGGSGGGGGGGRGEVEGRGTWRQKWRRKGQKWRRKGQKWRKEWQKWRKEWQK